MCICWRKCGHIAAQQLLSGFETRLPSQTAFDFEILSALRLTQNVYLLAKRRHIAEEQPFSGTALALADLLTRGSPRLSHGKLSDSLVSCAPLVDGRNATESVRRAARRD